MKESLFQDFLKEAAQAFKLPELRIDLQGACLLEFEKENVEILFEFDDSLVPNTILLSSKIISIIPQLYIDILEEVLISNFHLKETISCSPEEDVLYLHRRIHPKTTSEELSLIVGSFLNQITLWREKVKKLEANPPKQHRIPIPPSTFIIHPFQA